MSKTKTKQVEYLKRTLVSEMTAGDLFVKPTAYTVYTEDADGWASYRAACGMRFQVVLVDGVTLTARRISDADGLPIDNGPVLSQDFTAATTVLKVIVRAPIQRIEARG